ncbi:HPP family protein [Streptomyces sp. MS06]|uniref:HPP family protein n=1 Tax=Streptomyces sp. MS06 TaxID=3385974 RepID=UPI0039A30CD8
MTGRSPRARSQRARSQRARVADGARLFLLSAMLLTALGIIGRNIGWVVLTTTVGPTAYLLLARPGSLPSRWRSAARAHAVAVAAGLACLAAFGLWNHPSTSATGHETPRQIGAQALAVGATLFLLHVLGADHPPAAATALLITSGLARPGPPLYGMLAGLAVVLAAAPPLALLVPRPLERRKRGE